MNGHGRRQALNPLYKEMEMKNWVSLAGAVALMILLGAAC